MTARIPPEIALRTLQGILVGNLSPAMEKVEIGAFLSRLQP